jgi:D-proline reductase (dithiol) PrdB
VLCPKEIFYLQCLSNSVKLWNILILKLQQSQEAYMVDVNSLPDIMKKHLNDLDCPVFDAKPWVNEGPLSKRRVALVSSAGIHQRSDKHFTGGDASYRSIPGNVNPSDIVMSHVSVNFDRSAFQQNLNTILPIQHLENLADKGIIGSVSPTHYSFMGATDPRNMADEARHLATIMRADNVDTVVLLPV